MSFYTLAIQCEVPANPENGRAVYASVSYNSLISYECTYGYMLIGDSVRRCERNKEWTGTQPHCKGKLSKLIIICFYDNFISPFNTLILFKFHYIFCS